MFKVTVARKPNTGEYVGRPSPLGNPFVMRSEADRNVVCDNYQKWFDAQVEKRDPGVIGELTRLFNLAQEQGKLTLVCYCAPRRCHAQTIAKFLEDQQ